MRKRRYPNKQKQGMKIFNTILGTGLKAGSKIIKNTSKKKVAKQTSNQGCLLIFLLPIVLGAIGYFAIF